jgi:hypothetical protein
VKAQAVDNAASQWRNATIGYAPVRH